MVRIPSILLLSVLSLAPLASAQPEAPELPNVRECSEYQVDWYHCEGYLLCVAVTWGRLDEQACVEDPCPDWECVTCTTGGWCEGAWVRYCSEFMVDWHRCAGQLLCVQAGFGNVQTRNFCVVNPCSPGLAACFSCELTCCDLACSTPYVACHQDVGTTYGEIGCTGLGPITYVCVVSCPPYVQLLDCAEDTTGRVECAR